MRLIGMALALVMSVASLAQDEAPRCPDGYNCPRESLNPYPETGIWHNPDEPGSGFMFEVQDGILAGYYVGYDAIGDPVWYMISGKLEKVEEGPGDWRLETPLYRFQGGNCIDCLYIEPGQITVQGTITFEFLTRNTARYLINGQQQGRLQPLTFGSSGTAVFPGVDYLMPQITGQWLIIVYDRQTELEQGRREFAATGTDVWITSGTPKPGEINYSIDLVLAAPEIQGIGGIECRTQRDGSGGTCTVSLAQPPLEAKEFIMAASDLGDSYFKAIAKDGDTVEGFRVNYN